MKVNTDEIEDFLNISDFHDLPVNEIKLLTEDKEVHFVFSKWNDLKGDYENLVFRLLNVKSILFDQFERSDYQINELLNIKCLKINDEEFESLFIFHRGPDRPLWQMKVTFSEIDII
jgi:hypothetical protein